MSGTGTSPEMRGGRAPGTHTQGEMPFAMVQGEPFAVPDDLYIPPDALEVFLEAFEGPLDLLLYLIKRQNIDILDIPVAEITRQYMEYIRLMQDLRLELAAEYLVMASVLAEIKSRMLLPRPSAADEEEEDPRAELVRRLQEYERYKKAAEDLDALPRVEREIFPVRPDSGGYRVVRALPEVSLDELLRAFGDVRRRAQMFSSHHVQREALSVRERMSAVLLAVKGDAFTEFACLFRPEEGRMGVVVTLLALLELVREHLVELVQSDAFAPIYVRVGGSARGAGGSDVLEGA